MGFLACPGCGELIFVVAGLLSATVGSDEQISSVRKRAAIHIGELFFARTKREPPELTPLPCLREAPGSVPFSASHGFFWCRYITQYTGHVVLWNRSVRTCVCMCFFKSKY